jgi:hypothetical protein
MKFLIWMVLPLYLGCKTNNLSSGIANKGGGSDCGKKDIDEMKDAILVSLEPKEQKFLDDWGFNKEYVELVCKKKERDFQRMLPHLADLVGTFADNEISVKKQIADGKGPVDLSLNWVREFGKKARGITFSLESLSRIYVKGPYREKFEAATVPLKELEWRMLLVPGMQVKGSRNLGRLSMLAPLRRLI